MFQHIYMLQLKAFSRCRSCLYSKLFFLQDCFAVKIFNMRYEVATLLPCQRPPAFRPPSKLATSHYPQMSIEGI